MNRFAPALLTVGLITATGAAAQDRDGLSIGITVGVEHSDNALKLSENEIDDTKSYGQLELGLDAETRRIDVELDYFGELAHYENDTIDREDFWEGDASVVFTLLENRLSWEATHSRTEQLQNARDVDIRNNRESRDIFSTGPDLTLRLSQVDQLLLQGRWNAVQFQDTEQTDSERLSGLAGWQRRLSPTSTASLAYEYVDVEFDDLDETLAYERLYASYEVALKSSSYTISLGANRSDWDTLDDNEGFFGEIEWRLESGEHRLSLAATNQLTDSGIGLGGSGVTGGDFQPQDPNFGQLDEVERLGGRLGYGFDGLCARCQVDFGLDYDEQDFQTLDLDQERFGGSIGFTFQFSSRADLRWTARYSEIDFTADDRTDELTNMQLRLNWQLSRSLSVALWGFIDERDTSGGFVDGDFDETAGGVSLTYRR